jgi:hypothetical protein
MTRVLPELWLLYQQSQRLEAKLDAHHRITVAALQRKRRGPSWVELIPKIMTWAASTWKAWTVIGPVIVAGWRWGWPLARHYAGLG